MQWCGSLCIYCVDDQAGRCVMFLSFVILVEYGGSCVMMCML